MKKLGIMNKVSRTFGKAGLQIKKHSPEILVITGVVGTVAAAVMACKATTKLDTVLAESKENIDKINNYIETEGYSEQYTEEDGKKDLTITYVQSGLKVAKLYAPAVAVGALSITAILAGHNITRKRNVALAAAYTAVDGAFKEYRGRVVERFGEALDKELRYNIKPTEVEETVTDENGNEVIVTKTVNTPHFKEHSDYAKFFDEGCVAWSKDPEYNLMFLKQQQRFLNDLLKTRGHVFLNEAYDAVGIDRTTAGQVVGWIYDEAHPNGDNHIDFGLYDIDSEAMRRFINGIEPRVLLDFNVDGPIMNMI